MMISNYFGVFIACLSLISSIEYTSAQSVQWATNLDTIRSYPTAIASDDNQNFYSSLRNQTGNTTGRGGKIIKQDSTGNIRWELNYSGNGEIVGLIFKDSTLYLLGNYKDSLQLDTISLNATNGGYKRSFIASISSSGTFNWVTQTPWNENCELAEFNVNNNLIYAVGIRGDINSIIFALDLSGTLVRSKYVTNGIRTLSDIDFDSFGNLYIAGNSENNSSIDGVAIPVPSPFTGYIHFLMKLDTSWTAQWAISESHITFDFDDKVDVINDTVRFYYQYINTQNPTNKNIRVDDYTLNGTNLIKRQLLKSDKIKYTEIERNGKLQTIFAQQSYTAQPIYLHYYDKQFNKLRTDSIEGVSLNELMISGDREVLRGAISRYKPTLFNGQQIIPPYPKQFIYVTANFIIKYSSTTGLSEAQLKTFKGFPNPVANQYTIVSKESIRPSDFQIFNLQGQQMQVKITQESTNTLIFNMSQLKSGMYLLKGAGSESIKLIVN